MEADLDLMNKQLYELHQTLLGAPRKERSKLKKEADRLDIEIKEAPPVRDTIFK